MSNTKRRRGLTSKHLICILATMLVGIGGAAAFWRYSLISPSHLDNKNKKERIALKDPLPGELVMQTLMEDSVQDVRREDLKRSMTNIIKDYRKKFRHEHFTGYFMTDLDHDGLPELWVKVGSYRDNAKLELYYPMPDGTLRKSSAFAEPGQYYVGDGYLVQVVGSGPGYINVNRISISNGMMKVENERSIDLYADPDAGIPHFAEREIRHSSLQNLNPLNKSLL